MLIPILSSIIILALIFSAGSIIIYSIINGISPMPTSPKMKKVLLKALSDLRPTGKICELGSGWGTLAFPIAGTFTECEVYAYENSPIPLLYSRVKQRVLSYKNLFIRKEDIYTAPLDEFDFIICYLHTAGMEKLSIKFKEELKNNCVVVCNSFALPHWKPEKTIQINDIYKSKLYIYQVRRDKNSIHNFTA